MRPESGNGPALASETPVSFAQLARARRPGLRPTERRVVDHLLGVDPASADVTAAAVAGRLGVSQATVVNAVQRLGYAGFADFRRRLIAERAIAQAMQSNGAAAAPAAPVDPIAAIRRRVFDEDRAVVEATDHLLDDAAFRRAVEALAAAPQVFCVGSEHSGLMARLAAGTFVRCGVRATAEDYHSEQLAVVEVADPTTAVFAISYRGRNRRNVEVAARARARGMAVISLTNYASSRLARESDVVVLTAGPDLPDGVDPNQCGGRAAQFVIIRALATAVAWLRAEGSHPPVPTG